MATEIVTKDDVIRALDGLPAESLAEVRRFVDFVRFKSKRRPAPLPAERVEAILRETFGMWADRTDIPADGVEYVNGIRRGHRLDEFGLRSDETRSH